MNDWTAFVVQERRAADSSRVTVGSGRAERFHQPSEQLEDATRIADDELRWLRRRSGGS